MKAIKYYLLFLALPFNFSYAHKTDISHINHYLCDFNNDMPNLGVTASNSHITLQDFSVSLRENLQNKWIFLEEEKDTRYKYEATKNGHAISVSIAVEQLTDKPNKPEKTQYIQFFINSMSNNELAFSLGVTNHDPNGNVKVKNNLNGSCLVKKELDQTNDFQTAQK